MHELKAAIGPDQRIGPIENLAAEHLTPVSGVVVGHRLRLIVHIDYVGVGEWNLNDRVGRALGGFLAIRVDPTGGPESQNRQPLLGG